MASKVGKDTFKERVELNVSRKRDAGSELEVVMGGSKWD